MGEENEGSTEKRQNRQGLEQCMAPGKLWVSFMRKEGRRGKRERGKNHALPHRAPPIKLGTRS